MEELYILNNKFRIDKIDNIKFNPEYTEEVTNRKEEYVLVNEDSRLTLLINSSIYNFLKYFENSNSIDIVIKEFYKMANIEYSEDLEKKLIAFFQEMTGKRLLVKYDSSSSDSSNINQLADINEYIDEYSSIELLAKKRVTEIYKAIDKDSNTVALKIIRLNSNNNTTNSLNLLYEEYRILNKLVDIENVVKPIKFIKNNYLHCLVLNFINGENLSDYIKKSDKEILFTKVSLINSLLESMSKLHELNIIHGDIHGRNFIIEENNKIKIIDFGLSRDNTLNTNIEKAFGGVDIYMPPERISNNIFRKHVFPPDMKGEVYQIGILIKKLLTLTEKP